MPLLTGRELHYLEQIAYLVQEMCGDNNEHVRCDCLDEDYDAPHDPLCAWDSVWPVLDILSNVPGYIPEKAVEAFAEVRGIIGEAEAALHQKHVELNG